MNKLDVIKKTIKALEGGIEYNWTSPLSCNCGILAQQALNVDKMGLSKVFYGQGVRRSPNSPVEAVVWGGAAYSNSECHITGLLMQTVFKTLFDLGFDKDDIMHLENLSDPLICKKSGLDITDYGNFRKSKSHAILYLKAWVEILELQLVSEVKEVQYRTVIVEIDKKTKELTEVKLNMN